MKSSIIYLSIALLALLLGCNETMTNRYANYQEAEEDNLFKGGWVPDILPINTGQITETHNIDTNERCAEAVVLVDSMSNIKVRLQRKGFNEVDSQLPKLPSFRIGSEKCTFDLGNISGNRTVLTTPNEVVVLDIKASKFYFWSFLN